MAGTWAAWLLAALDRAVVEATLFAAVLFLLGGLDDLMVDVARAALWRRQGRSMLLADFPPAPPLRLAVFVPAWEEAAVIGAMLSAALSRWKDEPDFRLYVGCYPNDPATIAVVTRIAVRDARVRAVVGTKPGPTTKADCLNTLWHAMLAADAEEGRRTAAAILHDAEDVVHAAELRVHTHGLRHAALVQLPVVPLIDPAHRLVSGHYADEFAHSHALELVVRAAIGAGMPLAGVGCAIRRDALDLLAAQHGAPFAADSLTEDYELGLRVADLGLPACFLRVREERGGALVGTRAYFPHSVRGAVRQKTRWVTGISLAGWDRIGWGKRIHAAEWWMRLRDRRGLLAALVVATGYFAVAGWIVSALAHSVTRTVPPAPPLWLHVLLLINGALLAWRVTMRAATTAREHGWREAAWAVPRVVVSNMVAILSAAGALIRYRRMLRGGAAPWGKTQHRFPDLAA